MNKCNQQVNTNTHVFKDGKYYRDEKYFGDIIFRDENIIKVECKNGNRYMKGQIIIMHLQYK